MSKEDHKSPQCTATSKAKGTRCGRAAIPGGTVCRYHGGAAPQVKEAARLRLLEMVDPALSTLLRGLKGSGIPTASEVACARDVLDRAGFKPTDRTEITGAEGGPIGITVKYVKPNVN